MASGERMAKDVIVQSECRTLLLLLLCYLYRFLLCPGSTGSVDPRWSLSWMWFNAIVAPESFKSRWPRAELCDCCFHFETQQPLERRRVDSLTSHCPRYEEAVSLLLYAEASFWSAEVSMLVSSSSNSLTSLDYGFINHSTSKETTSASLFRVA